MQLAAVDYPSFLSHFIVAPSERDGGGGGMFFPFLSHFIVAPSERDGGGGGMFFPC